MKIYTRTGDEGKTSIIGGRVDKDDSRVEAYGSVDELNCFVGYALSILGESFEDIRTVLLEIQHELFDCGADLALANKEIREYRVHAQMVERLEMWIDHYMSEAPELRRFILPGGSSASALLHICRTECRRAERRVVSFAKEGEMNAEVRRYLNRLSDLFFTLARAVNARSGAQDVEYARSENVFRPRKG